MNAPDENTPANPSKLKVSPEREAYYKSLREMSRSDLLSTPITGFRRNDKTPPLSADPDPAEAPAPAATWQGDDATLLDMRQAPPGMEEIEFRRRRRAARRKRWNDYGSAS